MRVRARSRSSTVLADVCEQRRRVAVFLPDRPRGARWRTSRRSWRASSPSGSGPRAGDHEIAHLMTKTGATVLVTHAEHRGRPVADLASDLRGRGVTLDRVVTLSGPPTGGAEISVDGAAPRRSSTEPALTGERPGPDDLFLLNSTSGTTGLPKCVMHTQNRWFYFHRLAVAAGDAQRRRRVPRRGAGAVRLRALDRPLHADAARRADGRDGALRRRRGARPHRARAGDRAVLRQHPVHHDAERRRRAAAGPLVAAGRCSPAARPCPTSGRRRSRTHRRQRAAVLRVERDRRASAARRCATTRDRRLRHRRPGHRRDARAPVRRRRPSPTCRASGPAGVQGPGDVPRLLGRRRGQRASSSPPTAGC